MMEIPDSGIQAKSSLTRAKTAAKFWQKHSQIFALEFPGKVAARNFTKKSSTFSTRDETRFCSSQTRCRSKRGRTQKNANERKRAQTQVSKRAQKSAKGHKRAQKRVLRKNCKQPGLKQPGLGTPKRFFHSEILGVGGPNL